MVMKFHCHLFDRIYEDIANATGFCERLCQAMGCSKNKYRLDNITEWYPKVCNISKDQDLSITKRI